MENKPIRQALISVSDQQGLVELAKFLTENGVQLLATDRTAQYLQQHQIDSTHVSDYTGFPAIMGGRVKTLHPKIYGGILTRGDQDQRVIEQHGMIPIDLVVVNFYPFQHTIKQNCTIYQAIEQIDIGGPCMVRAAAKNYQYVTVATDPQDYSAIIQALSDHQLCIPITMRLNLAYKAFNHTAHYDSVVQQYLQQHIEQSSSSTTFPAHLTLPLSKKQSLRYGENPQQQAAVYQYDPPIASQASLIHSKQYQGKPLSFNNLADGDAALNCVMQWCEPQFACVIVKHATPCGVAIADCAVNAYQRALTTDPQAAFGGIIAFNCSIDQHTAQVILTKQFAELVIAPHISDEALTLLASKPNLRVISYHMNDQSQNHQPVIYQYRSINGGLLAQTANQQVDQVDDWQVATSQQPTLQQRNDLLFAWQVVRWVKSNAIVCAKDGVTYGIGSGQVSRIASMQIALEKAKDAGFDLSGAVIASDAFFPFRDAIDLAAQAGIHAIVQPGGSKRDSEVISAANEAHIAMLLTSVRHFWH